MLDKCENCGHEGLIRDKGGTIAFRVSGPNGPQTKVIRGFEFRQCPMCGVMVPPWDLVERVAADPEVTNLDLDPPTYPEMSMDPPTTSNHVQIARYGTDFWNQCRLERSEVRPSLRGAFLKDAKLGFANLRDADLAGATLSGSTLSSADLTDADLAGANLSDQCVVTTSVPGFGMQSGMMVAERTNLSGAKLNGANLRGANLAHAELSGASLVGATLHDCVLTGASLVGADLSGAELVGADLTGANMTEADCREATLSGCRVYGTSTWGMRLENAEQSGLIITPEGQPEVSVDGIEVAQFVYLLLSNKSIRGVIDSLATRAVLVLGRFSPERKPVLETIRAYLRSIGRVPIVFDFEGPETQDVLETVQTLAFISGMVICDMSDPRSLPEELQAIVPHRAVPIAPLIEEGQKPWGMLAGLKKYSWLLQPFVYQDVGNVTAVLRDEVLPAAIAKAEELAAARAADRPSPECVEPE